MKIIISATIVIAIALFLFERILGQDAEQRSYIYFDDMYESVAYKAQSENPFLPDGVTQQPPPEGTIPRGYQPQHYGTDESEMKRAGEELMTSLTADNYDAGKAQEIYRIYCQVCHGPGGLGDGPVVSRGYPPPTSLLADQAKLRSDGEMFHIITYGLNNMPGYAAQVSQDNRWQVIAYIRQLQAAAEQQAQEAQNDTLNTTL